MNQASITGGYWEDASAAYDEFTSLVLDVATEHDWTSEETDAILADVDAAYEASDQGLSFSDLWGEGDDVGAFWAELEDRAQAWTVTRADELRAVIAAAIGTNETIAAEEVTAADVVVGTVEGSIEDVAEGVEEVKDTVESPYFKPAVLIFALLVAAVALK